MQLPERVGHKPKTTNRQTAVNIVPEIDADSRAAGVAPANPPEKGSASAMMIPDSNSKCYNNATTSVERTVSHDLVLSNENVFAETAGNHRQNRVR